MSLPAPLFFALGGAASVFPPPPGPLLLVASDSNRDIFGPCVSGYATVRRTLDEYLAQAPRDRPVRRHFPGILMDWDGLFASSPLILLHRAHQLLRQTGRLIILIGHESTDEERAAGNRRKAFYLQALAKHCGFSVHPTSAPHNATAPVLVLQKSRAVRWRLTQPEPEHVPALIALFRRSFEGEISPEFWRWKYGEGRGRAIIASHDGQIIAHYGGTTRRISFRGLPFQALEICDVMVAPGERGVMTKRGAFFQVASAFLETFFGYHDEHLLAFGFPNHRAMRVAARMGLYGEVDRVAEIRWTPLYARPRFTTVLRAMEGHPDTDGIVGALWGLMQKDLPESIAVIRDSAYLRYRYLLHPHHAYEVLTVLDRFTGCPRGLVVLRRDAEECKLLDIVAPLKEIPLLIDHVRRQSARWGLPGVTAWITMPFAALFLTSGGRQTATEGCIPANMLTEGPSVQQLKGRWWLMMGDTDFL